MKPKLTFYKEFLPVNIDADSQMEFFQSNTLVTIQLQLGKFLGKTHQTTHISKVDCEDINRNRI